METIGGGGGDAAGDGGGIETEKKKCAPEGEGKSKRKMKTPTQRDVLERAYAVETYPSEALRAELSAQLGLTDRQLQMWFCHRRSKDRKATPPKKPSQCPPPQVAEELVAVAGVGNVEESRLGLGSSPLNGMDRQGFGARLPGVAVPRISDTMSGSKRYNEPQQSSAELRAIAFVEAQLGEPLREDGPTLGMEFDPLPPDAFGAPIGTAAAAAAELKQPGQSFEGNLYEQPDVKPSMGATRAVCEYQFIPQRPSVRADAYERATSSYQYGSPSDSHHSMAAALTTGGSVIHENGKVPSKYDFASQTPSLTLPQEGRLGHLLPSASGGSETLPPKNFVMNVAVDGQFSTHSTSALENPLITSGGRVRHEDVLRLQRKRKSEEARLAREVESYEKRTRKELEKQDILRRKREEQIRKEMERQERERRKEKERILREKQREEERYQRERRRELERRERFLQKESIRAERMRQKEELRREKEAARQKAASERATARRIAKESIELVDDERLELMELAALSKELPSAPSLDTETSLNLDLFRDKLPVFPPRSVTLNRPFAIQPWKDSEEAVADLLMVWRFLITFTDVLGLWPFTLDEFVQAFHDYDSRLLGEVHIALLQCIIQDIEDVARTSAATTGANQNNAVNPGGGHPHIVEGAYTWGFDIYSWKSRINPLTWPEILRQLALSAGLGPQLKKKNDQAYLDDDGNDGEDVISNLRSGVAVENAVAIMHEKGISNSRRSRHRLTPGTVKFAVFHVLSVEGSQGLTTLEIAEKIQKSELRDLTTSKTPEASISAALSRDTKLFERVAPSTYCVRAAYRKDPVDAESVLSEARERIRIFRSGFVDGVVVERDEDSDSDVPEEPEVDDLGTELNPNRNVSASLGASKLTTDLNMGNGKTTNVIVERKAIDVESVVDGLPLVHSNGSNVHIDENELGESWVQGLVEGDYSDLSVEERLNALVALIGVVIEGSSIHVILEERLEAAYALKKQMWAESQLDKRRTKEVYVTRVYDSSYTGNKAEHAASGIENRQSQSIAATDISSEIHLNTADPQTETGLNNGLLEKNSHMGDFSATIDKFSSQQSGHVVERSRSQLKSFVGRKAEEIYEYRSLPLGLDRRRNRYWHFTTSASHNDPGCGRIFVELRDGRWRLIDSEEAFDALLVSLDLRGIRESNLHMMLKKIEISFKETVRRNMLHPKMLMQSEASVKAEADEIGGALDCNGCIDSPRSMVCAIDSDRSETSTSFVIDLGRNDIENLRSLKRYQDFENWMWKECVNPSMFCAMKHGRKRCAQILSACDVCHDVYLFGDHHCPSCHSTYKAVDYDMSFSEHVARCEEEHKMNPNSSAHDLPSPLRLRLLKLQLAIIEVSLPLEALQPSWTNDTRTKWGIYLESATSAEDLLQVLTLLEGALKKEFISSTFGTTGELLGSYASSPSAVNYPSADIPVLPWLPQTSPAVALRLLEFDSSISYIPLQVQDSQGENIAGSIIKLPSRNSVTKSSQKIEPAENVQVADSHQKGNGVDVGFGLSQLRGSQRISRSHTLGGRPQRKIIASSSESRKNKAGRRDMLEPVLDWKSQSSVQAEGTRGRRSIRIRKKPTKLPVVSTEVAKAAEKTTGNLVENGWDIEPVDEMEDSGNASSTGRSNYEDEDGQAAPNDFEGIASHNYAADYAIGSSNLLDPRNDGTRRNVNYSDYDIDEPANHRNDLNEDDATSGDDQQNMDLFIGSNSTSSSDFSD